MTLGAGLSSSLGLIPFIPSEEMFVLLFICPSHRFYYPDIVLFLTWAAGQRSYMNDDVEFGILSRLFVDNYSTEHSDINLHIIKADRKQH